jgi:hypothetical protein
MSTAVMGLCWPLQMPPTAKAVLMSLADQANDQGVCWPAITSISDRTCYGRTAVIEAIKWLEARKAIEIERGASRSNRYTLTPHLFEGDTSGDAHYVYCITHKPTGSFYIGLRSCYGAPEKDTYFGSGKACQWLESVPGEREGDNANLRNGLHAYAARQRSKRDGSKRAEVIPGQSVGTHRPDREESDYPLDTRNRRSVWTIATQPFAEAHFATMAPELAETCIKAGCPEGGTVLDPFGGAGTTGLVADRLQRDAVLVELNAGYIDIARRRIAGDAPLFAEMVA